MSVVTFYSFKGGVGRTQALANVAAELCRRGRRVILVDLDLESPGVDAYFGPGRGGAPQPGLLDWLDAWRTAQVPPDLDEYLVEVMRGPGSVRLLGPGRLDADYSRRLANLSWERLYKEEDGDLLMERLREELVRRADHVLVDSRTGMTDIATICTFQLPDFVVALFALHRQGIEGTALVARALAARMSERDPRLGRVALVPARVDEADGARVTEWLDRAREAFGGLPPAIGLLQARDDQTFRVPYDRDVAYGEHIVMDTAREGRLAAAYRFLADLVEDARSVPEGEAARWEADAAHLAGTGRRDEAVRLLRRAVSLRRTWGAPGSVEADLPLAKAQHMLAQALAGMGRTQEAIDVGMEAADRLMAHREVSSSVGAELAWILDDLAIDLGRLGRFTQALAMNRQAAERYRALFAAEREVHREDFGRCLANLSARFAEVGELGLAVDTAREAVELFRADPAPPDRRIQLANALNNYANVLADSHRHLEALPAIEEAVAIYRAASRGESGAHAGYLAAGLNNLANCLGSLDRDAEALAAIEEAYGLYRRLAEAMPGGYLDDLAMAANNYALCLAAVGRREEAMRVAEESVERFRALWRDVPEAFVSGLARSLACSAWRKSDAGRFEEALDCARESIELLRPSYVAMPAANEAAMATCVRAYLDVSGAQGRPVDEALLEGLPLPARTESV